MQESAMDSVSAQKQSLPQATEIVATNSVGSEDEEDEKDEEDEEDEEDGEDVEDVEVVADMVEDEAEQVFNLMSNSPFGSVQDMQDLQLFAELSELGF